MSVEVLFTGPLGSDGVGKFRSSLQIEIVLLGGYKDAGILAGQPAVEVDPGKHPNLIYRHGGAHPVVANLVSWRHRVGLRRAHSRSVDSDNGGFHRNDFAVLQARLVEAKGEFRRPFLLQIIGRDFAGQFGPGRQLRAILQPNLAGEPDAELISRLEGLGVIVLSSAALASVS